MLVAVRECNRWIFTQHLRGGSRACALNTSPDRTIQHSRWLSDLARAPDRSIPPLTTVDQSSDMEVPCTLAQKRSVHGYRGRPLLTYVMSSKWALTDTAPSRLLCNCIFSWYFWLHSCFSMDIHICAKGLFR